MTTITIWRTRPVFITSTFRDMHAERDYLRTRIFPALEERLHQRRTHLEPIDLRWGVETVAAGEEHAKELLVLKVCLAEVERSKPFLIGLIGDRYGWVPPKERMAAAAQEAGFAGEVAGRSVTDLEIDFGVLSRPEQRQRCFFYLRDPLPYARMPPALAAQFSEAFNSEPDADKAAARLAALKQRLEIQLPGRVRHYAAQWDTEENMVTSLEVWGQQVLEDLWQELKEESAEPAQQRELTWQEAEAWTLEQFVEDRARNFIGRDQTLATLLTLAHSPAQDGQPWGMCVTGSPGAGKSALFAELYRRLNKENVFVLAHATGISPRSTQVDAMLRRWIPELAGVLGISQPLEEKATAEEVEQTFQSLLGRAGTQQRVVILIDALNQFEPTPRARHLTWLPKFWPPHVRLIATAIPSDASKALLQRPATETFPLPPLSENEATEIARAICRRYHRDLNPGVLEVLCTKKRTDGQPAEGNPLWLELAVEELNLLDADDFARADREFTGSPEQRLHKLLLTVANEMPAEVEAMYSWMLERAEQLFGEAWAQAFVNLIAVSRAGWRESDLRALMPIASAEGWEDLKFAALRRTFRAHVVQRGAQAQWDFSHVQMRAAIERRYLAREETRRARHALLAAHLAALPSNDPLRQSERMFHLIGADDRTGAASHYGDPGLSTGEVSGATGALAAHMAACGEEGVEWVASLVEVLEEDARLRWIAQRFLFDLQDAMADLTAVTARLRVAEAAQRAIDELRRREPESAEYAHDLSISYSKLGDLLFGMGEPQRALESYRKHLAIAEELRRRAPEEADYASALEISYERLGILHQVELGEPQRALEFYQKALAISEELRQRAPESAQYARGLGLNYYRLGELFRELGELKRALDFYHKHLAIGEELRRQLPESAEYACDLELSYCRAGSLYRDLGELQRALEFFQKALVIGEDLQRRVPDNTEFASNLLVTYGELGQFHVGRGELQRALEFSQKALAIGEELQRRVPDNAEYARKLAVNYSELGELHRRLGEPQRALEFFQKSLPLREELHRQAPESAEYARDLSISYSELGELHRELDELRRALEFFQKALSLREASHRRASENADYARALGVSYERLGILHIDLGQPQRALEFIQKSLSLREELWHRAPENTVYASDLSVLYNTLGNVHSELGEPQRGLEFYQKAVAIAENLWGQVPESAEYAHNLAQFCFNVLLCAQDADHVLAASCAGCILTVVEEMRKTGMFVDENLNQMYQQVRQLIEDVTHTWNR